MSEENYILKHYKKIESFEADVQDADLFLASGKNEIGKTSLLIFIIETIMGKSLTPEALQRGQTEGFGQFPATDKKGNPVLCTHSFKKDKNGKEVHDFKIIDHLGNTYSTPNKIRELLGVVTIMSIDDFFRNCQTAEGKRKIQKDLIYKLLNEELLKEIQVIDNNLTTDSELFKGILEIEKELNTKNILLIDKKLTDDDKLLLGNLEKLKQIITDNQLIIETNKTYEENNKDKTKEIEIANVNKENHSTSLVTLDKWKKIELQKIEVHIKEINEYYDNQFKIHKEAITSADTIITNSNIQPKPYKNEEINEASTKVEEAKKYLLSVDVIAKKQKEVETITKEIAPLQSLLLTKNQEKAKIKERRLEILQSLNLPSVTFDENTFYIDEFEIKDTQVSKSRVGLVLAELLCRINENRIVYFGSMTDFDKERFKQLFKIFKKYQKLPLLEQISTFENPKLIFTIDDIKF